MLMRHFFSLFVFGKFQNAFLEMKNKIQQKKSREKKTNTKYTSHWYWVRDMYFPSIHLYSKWWKFFAVCYSGFWLSLSTRIISTPK